MVDGRVTFDPVEGPQDLAPPGGFVLPGLVEEPVDALVAASTTARAFLGEPGPEEGAPADLVVYRQDPRNDPEVLSRPEAIVFGGRRVL